MRILNVQKLQNPGLIIGSSGETKRINPDVRKPRYGDDELACKSFESGHFCLGLKKKRKPAGIIPNANDILLDREQAELFLGLLQMHFTALKELENEVIDKSVIIKEPPSR